MPIDKLGQAISSGPVSGARESFGKLLETAPRPVLPTTAAPGPAHALPGPIHAGPPPGVSAHPPETKPLARAVEQVKAAQERLDHVLQLAQAGRTFTPAELLALQAQVYGASQQLDLAGKVVEKAVSGVKQILQTQV